MSRVKRNRKIKVWMRDNFKCFYCYRDLSNAFARNMVHPESFCEITIDHKVPVHLGGTNEQDNLVTCCFECNQKKDTKERKIILNK